MWRVIFLLCCLLAFGITAKVPTKYSKGKCTIYKYNGYLVAGMPSISYTYAGYYISTTVRLQNHDDKRFTLLLKDTKIKRIANDIGNAKASTLAKEFYDTLSTLSKKVLELAVEFKWEGGQVRDLKKSPLEETESLNIKRSILSMICGKFGSIVRGTKRGKFDWRSLEGVDGTCATSFTYSKTGAKSYEMTKVRDLSNCTSVPPFLITNLKPANLKRCDKPKESMQNSRFDSSTRTVVDLRRSADGFFIVRSKVNTRMAVEVIGEGLKDQVLKIRQELNYHSTSDLEEVSTSTFKKVGMEMEMPHFKLIKDEKVFVKLANEAITRMQEKKYSVESAKLQYKLIQILQMGEKDHIKRLLKKYKKNEYVMKVIGSILSACGTPTTVEVIKEMLEDPSISDKDASEIALKAASTSAAPAQLATVYQTLIDKNTFVGKGRPKTLQAIIVGVGSLINILNKNEKDDQKYSELLRNYYVALKAKDMSKDMTAGRKTLTFLMSLGNSGLEGVVDIIESYLQKGNSLVIRLMALRALRKIAVKRPTETWDTIFPILSDKGEDTQVRINAFMLIDNSLPSTYHLAMIAQFIRREKDMNLRNYMVSYYKAISTKKRKTVCNMQWIAKARWIIKMLPLKLRQVSITRSRVYIMPLLTGKNRIELWIQLIHTSDSLIPRSIQMFQYFATDDRMGELSEIEISSFDNQKAIREIMNLMATTKAGGKFQAPSLKKFGKITARISTFGDDVLYMKDSAAAIMMNMMKAFQFSGNSNFALTDQYITYTSFGLPVYRKNGMSYVGLMKVNQAAPKMNDGKFTVTCKSAFSEAMFTQSSVGIFMGRTAAEVSYTTGMSLFPGGETEFEETHIVSPNSLKFKWLLGPYGKGRTLTSMKDSIDVELYTEKNGVMSQKTIPMKTFKSVVEQTFVVGGNVGFPVQITTTMKSFSFEALKKKSTPSSLTIKTKDGVICGIGIELQRDFESDQQTSGFEDDGTEADYVSLINIAKSADALPDLAAYPMNWGKSTRNVDITMNFNTFVLKGGKPDKITSAKATVQFRKKSLRNNVMTLNFKKGNRKMMEITAEARDSGPPVFFNPNNPFRVTKNMKRTATIIGKVFNREYFRMTRTMTMSKDWIDGWKRIVADSKLMSYLYPHIADCIENNKNGFKYSNSPDCIRTFETIQNFDSHEIAMKFKPKVGTMLKPLVDYWTKAISGTYFTELSNKFESGKITMKGKVSPSSFGYFQNNRVYQQERLMMNGFNADCDVAVFSGERKHIFVNSFNKQRYSATLSESLFEKDKNQKLVLVQDAQERLFTVSIAPYNPKRTLIQFVNNGKQCNIVVENGGKDGPSIETSGLGCDPDDSYKQDSSYFLENSVTIDIKNVKVQVITRPGEYARISVGGMFYGESLRGVCGQYNMESKSRSWAGKSCKRSYFKSPEEFTKDFVMKQPLKLATCK